MISHMYMFYNGHARGRQKTASKKLESAAIDPKQSSKYFAAIWELIPVKVSK